MKLTPSYALEFIQDIPRKLFEAIHPSRNGELYLNFELTEEQEEIRMAVREFAEKEFTPEVAREYDEKEEFPM